MTPEKIQDPAQVVEIGGGTLRTLAMRESFPCWNRIDGSEIRRSPVDMVNIYLQDFSRWLLGIFVFNQQYEKPVV